MFLYIECTSKKVNPKIENSKIDERFTTAEAWAKPLLYNLRDCILKCDPEIKEEWKWGPAYSKNGLICGIWPFKNHVSLIFFKGSLLKDFEGLLIHGSNNLYNRMIKFTPDQRPDFKVVEKYIREAIRVDKLRESPKPATHIEIPKDLQDLLDANGELATYFGKLAYTHRKEFIVWINEAKRPETRLKRLEKTIEMLLAKQNR